MNKIKTLQDIIKLTHKELFHFISFKEVKAIITVLFNIMTRKMLSGEIIKIQNFGKFRSKKDKAFLRWNIVSKKIERKTNENILIKFSISKKIGKILKNNLDLDEMLRDKK